MVAIAVTPVGVRDGDPDALAGLCDRRGPAVLAYCEVVAGRGERGTTAAAHAFGSFRAGVVAAEDLANLNPEALLISATRHAAARHAACDTPEPHARVPGLLAARADRSITAADHAWLGEHLDSCWSCRAPVARFEAADRAYRNPPRTPLPVEAAAAIIGALLAAAPLAGAMRLPTPDEAAVHTNGNGPYEHAAPTADPDVAPAAGPRAEFDPASVEGYVDQATAAWQVGADDADIHVPPHEPPPYVEDAARRARRSARRAVGLGAIGRKGKPRAERAPGLTRRPRVGRKGEATATGRAAAEPTRRDLTAAGGLAAGRDDREAEEGLAAATARSAADATAADRAAARRARTRNPRPERAGAAGSGRGASLPRPSRERSAAGSARRSRSALRPGVLLPIVLVVLAIVVALLIAGVFGGGEAASKPQSFAPDQSTPASQAAPSVVVVPGASGAGAAAVERAKARARAAERRAKQAEAAPDVSGDDATAAGSPTAAPTPNPTPPPPPPPADGSAAAPADTNQGSGGAVPQIDAGTGESGAEPPTDKDASTVPELAPPTDPAVPPPG